MARTASSIVLGIRMSLHCFRQRDASLPLVFAACAGIGLLAPGMRASAAEMSGNAALTTDYVFRGVTQTQGDPAAQMGAKVVGNSGLYGSVWGSTVESQTVNGASSEIDYVVGWSGKPAQDWAFDVNVTYFDYPAARAAIDYSELVGTLTWRDSTWLTVGYSPDVFATRETGIYAQLGAKFPVNDVFRIEAAVAHYNLDEAYRDSYAHAQLGVVWAFEVPFELRVTAHDTDSAAEKLFPGLAGSRIEVALQASL